MTHDPVSGNQERVSITLEPVSVIPSAFVAQEPAPGTQERVSCDSGARFCDSRAGLSDSKSLAVSQERVSLTQELVSVTQERASVTNSSQREQGRLQRLGLLLRLLDVFSAMCSVDWSLMLYSANMRPPSNFSPNQMSRFSSRGVPSWARIFAFTVSIV